MCGTNAMDALFGSHPSHRSSLSFLCWLQGPGWGEGKGEWGKCRRLFLNPSLYISLSIPLSVCLFKFLQCGLNPWLLPSLFPFAYLSQLYARAFCEKRAACEGCLPLWACMCVCVCACVCACVCGCLDSFHAKTKVCFAYVKENIGIHTIITYEASKQPNGKLHATLHAKERKERKKKRVEAG